MQLIHILYSGLGGHGAVLFALLENDFMPTAKHHVMFIGIEKPREEYIERCVSLNVSWSYVARSTGQRHLQFVILLFKRLREMDAEVVFSHGLASVLSLTLYRIFSPKKRFLVLRETQAHHLKLFREWIFLSLANLIFDRIVYLTEEAKNGANKKLGFLYRARKSIVIGNGLDTEYFSPNSPRIASNSIKIGMQSRLQANKDHRTLIDAFNILSHKNPGLDLSLHIAGDGDTYESLNHYVESLSLTDKIFFHGMLGQRDLKDFLNSLSIYVHCTHGETMSTAIMQAFSMGLPVIASDVWGVSNMIKNYNGLLYRPNDALHLAEKIESVLQNDELKKSLAGRARQYAELNFSNTRLTKKYTEIFSSSE